MTLTKLKFIHLITGLNTNVTMLILSNPYAMTFSSTHSGFSRDYPAGNEKRDSKVVRRDNTEEKPGSIPFH